MPITTKSCDVCGVRNSEDTPVEKDPSGKWACPKHKSAERLVAPGPSASDPLYQALDSRVKKLEGFIGETNELKLAEDMGRVLDDRLKVLGLDEKGLADKIAAAVKKATK